MNAIKREIPIFDSIDKYTHWLISNFTSIAKGAKFTFELLAKMTIGENIIAQEKKDLTKILYNKEAVLVWDFTEIGKVKKEVAFL